MRASCENVFSPLRIYGKVQMLQTCRQPPTAEVTAAKAVPHGPGAFVFDIVT